MRVRFKKAVKVTLWEMCRTSRSEVNIPAGAEYDVTVIQAGKDKDHRILKLNNASAGTLHPDRFEDVPAKSFRLLKAGARNKIQ